MDARDVGFHGSEIRTPNIDDLAKGGARLEQFYAQPMCTPTRAALMTGRYPLRYGLQSFVILPEQTYGIPLDEKLLPEVLKSAGYDTAIIGKWHLGHARIQALAKAMVPSQFFEATFKAYLGREVGKPALPNSEAFYDQFD